MTPHKNKAIREIMLSPDKNEAILSLTDTKRDEYFMKLALSIAKAAALDGEVPVGCVIVKDSVIISCGGNGRESGKNALHHAEIEAIDGACKALGGWRLPKTTLYVTLEPCVMCAGAIINARIDRVVFAAKDAKAGAMGSVLSVNSYPLGYKPQITGGEVLAKEARELLTEFFMLRRQLNDK